MLHSKSKLTEEIQISITALFIYGTLAATSAGSHKNQAVDNRTSNSQLRELYRMNLPFLDKNMVHPVTKWGPARNDEEYDETKANECQISNNMDLLVRQRWKNGSISRPIYRYGIFTNPWSTWRPLAFLKDELQNPFLSISDFSSATIVQAREELDVQKPNLTNPPTGGQFKVTWIGHSTLLIQVDGYNILTDPIFSQHASPKPFPGPARFQDPALKISELPPIDIVILSHNHFDHFDYDSIEAINKRFGSACRWLVPLGVGKLLQAIPIENYRELDWWKKDCFPVTLRSMRSSCYFAETLNHKISMTDKMLKELQRGQLQIYMTPAQHWSRQTLTDFCRTLWSSYTLISSSGKKFFFTGDTGYCPAFKEIFEIFGHMDGAAIPIGAYGPRWFTKSFHVDPADAIEIHRDLKSQKSMAIHWGTFKLSLEPYMEPAQLLRQLMADESHSNDTAFITVKHGSSLTF